MDEGSAHRKAAAYTGQHKHRINLDIHPGLKWGRFTFFLRMSDYLHAPTGYFMLLRVSLHYRSCVVRKQIRIAVICASTHDHQILRLWRLESRVYCLLLLKKWMKSCSNAHSFSLYVTKKRTRNSVFNMV
jgi:hypothetical protein